MTKKTVSAYCHIFLLDDDTAVDRQNTWQGRYSKKEHYINANFHKELEFLDEEFQRKIVEED